MFRNDARAKRHKRKLRILETLQAPRDAHDRNAEHEPDHRRFNGKRHAAHKDPEHIQQHGADASAVHDVLPEGREHQLGKFEALQPPRDAHDRDAPEQSRERPAEPEPQARKHEPKNVADKTHRILLFPHGRQ